MKSLSQDKYIETSYLSSGKWDVGQVRHGISIALIICHKTISGPSCSKLTMSLVNLSLKIWIIKYGLYTNISAEKI